MNVVLTSNTMQVYNIEGVRERVCYGMDYDDFIPDGFLRLYSEVMV